MPKLVISEPGSGRTTELIRAAAENETHGVVCYIVCHSQQEAYRISKLAEEMELNIGFPITYDEFLRGSYSNRNIDKLYIDNLRMFLTYISNVPIDTVVW